MANIGTWRAPFPLRFGGGSHKRVSHAFDTIRANVGTSLSSDMESANVAEDIAAARLLTRGGTIVDVRIAQYYPRKLTWALERWEAILGITSGANDTDQVRRSRIASRMLGNYTSTSAALSRIAAEAFYPWRTAVHYVGRQQFPGNSQWVKWPPNGNTYEWSSPIASFSIEYVRPAGASDSDVHTRLNAAYAAFDEHVAAWATFTFSETQEGGTNANLFGFYCDQPNLDRAVLSN